MPWVPLLLIMIAPAAWTQGLTLAETVRRAPTAYAALEVSAGETARAAAAIELARMAYLPKVDFLAQVNRATRNNVFGMLLPQTVIPPISGPPNPNNSVTSVWGTATGFLVNWEPFDFGLRKANIDVASAARRRAELGAERVRFETEAGAADAFLTLLAAERTAGAADASVARAKAFFDIVAALVKADLRPGAEASRARAELALAETQRIRAREAIAEARALLQRYAGKLETGAAIDAGKLAGEAPAEGAAGGAVDAHPAVREQSAAIDESVARAKALDRSLFPRFNTQAALYARGTGANPDFTTGGAAAGLGPSIHNWGIGMTMTIPVTEFWTIKPEKQIEAQRERTESARLKKLKQDLNVEVERARARIEAARLVAAQMPVQLEAARAAETQATARYRAGLSNGTEVAEAQRLLAQTEIDAELARLGIWRSLLGLAIAQGDLAPFLAMAEGR